MSKIVPETKPKIYMISLIILTNCNVLIAEVTIKNDLVKDAQLNIKLYKSEIVTVPVIATESKHRNEKVKSLPTWSISKHNFIQFLNSSKSSGSNFFYCIFKIAILMAFFSIILPIHHYSPTLLLVQS